MILTVPESLYSIPQSIPFQDELETAPGDAGAWIEGRLVADLMSSAWQTQLTLVVVLAIMFGVLYGNVWAPGLYAWLAGTTAITLYRLYVVQLYRNTLQHASADQQIAFLNRYGFTWPLSAFAWASSACLYFDKAPLYVQSICWLILTGIGTFAVTSFAAHLSTLRSYVNTLAIVITSAIGWRIAYDLAFHAPVQHYMLLLMIVMYWVLLLQNGARLHATQRASVELQHANANLIRSLKAQTRTALEAIQTKNRFIASAAHDLRQPVHALGLYADWLRNEPELVRELTPKIVQSTKAVNELFDALFDLVRLDSGKVKPDWQEVALDAMVQSLMVQYAPQAESKGLSLRLRSTPCWVWSDPIMLRRILGNLLSNAVRHTAKGGVLLAVRPHGQSARVEVWDTGSGIASEHQQMIFREFYRIPLHQGTEEGFGLGLSIVSRLSVALGHPLGLQSRVGSGTVFRLTVPLARLG
jgi:signal transduction histidine kinase